MPEYQSMRMRARERERGGEKRIAEKQRVGNGWTGHTFDVRYIGANL